MIFKLLLNFSILQFLFKTRENVRCMFSSIQNNECHMKIIFPDKKQNIFFNMQFNIWGIRTLTDIISIFMCYCTIKIKECIYFSYVYVRAKTVHMSPTMIYCGISLNVLSRKLTAGGTYDLRHDILAKVVCLVANVKKNKNYLRKFATCVLPVKNHTTFCIYCSQILLIIFSFRKKVGSV